MAPQYLLTCECGVTQPIETNQAGSSVVCRCGKTLEVPSLRAIRELPRVENENERPRAEWNPAAGLIFVTGMFLAFLGAGAAFYMHMNAIQISNFEMPPEDEVEAWVAEVDDAPPEELFNMWNASRHMGLGEHQASPFVRARQVAERFAAYRNIGLIVLASGLVFAATSFLVRGKPAAG